MSHFSYFSRRFDAELVLMDGINSWELVYDSGETETKVNEELIRLVRTGNENSYSTGESPDMHPSLCGPARYRAGAHVSFRSERDARMAPPGGYHLTRQTSTPSSSRGRAGGGSSRHSRGSGGGDDTIVEVVYPPVHGAPVLSAKAFLRDDALANRSAASDSVAASSGRSSLLAHEVGSATTPAAAAAAAPASSTGMSAAGAARASVYLKETYPGYGDAALGHLLIAVSVLVNCRATGDVGASRTLAALSAAMKADDALWLLHACEDALAFAACFPDDDVDSDDEGLVSDPAQDPMVQAMLAQPPPPSEHLGGADYSSSSQGPGGQGGRSGSDDHYGGSSGAQGSKPKRKRRWKKKPEGWVDEPRGRKRSGHSGSGGGSYADGGGNSGSDADADDDDDNDEDDDEDDGVGLYVYGRADPRRRPGRVVETKRGHALVEYVCIAGVRAETKSWIPLTSLVVLDDEQGYRVAMYDQEQRAQQQLHQQELLLQEQQDADGGVGDGSSGGLVANEDGRAEEGLPQAPGNSTGGAVALGVERSSRQRMASILDLQGSFGSSSISRELQLQNLPELPASAVVLVGGKKRHQTPADIARKAAKQAAKVAAQQAAQAEKARVAMAAAAAATAARAAARNNSATSGSNTTAATTTAPSAAAAAAAASVSGPAGVSMGGPKSSSSSPGTSPNKGSISGGNIGGLGPMASPSPGWGDPFWPHSKHACMDPNELPVPRRFSPFVVKPEGNSPSTASTAAAAAAAAAADKAKASSEEVQGEDEFGEACLSRTADAAFKAWYAPAGGAPACAVLQAVGAVAIAASSVPDVELTRADSDGNSLQRLSSSSGGLESEQPLSDSAAAAAPTPLVTGTAMADNEEEPRQGKRVSSASVSSSAISRWVQQPASSGKGSTAPLDPSLEAADAARSSVQDREGRRPLRRVCVPIWKPPDGCDLVLVSSSNAKGSDQGKDASAAIGAGALAVVSAAAEHEAAMRLKAALQASQAEDEAAAAAAADEEGDSNQSKKKSNKKKAKSKLTGSANLPPSPFAPPEVDPVGHWLKNFFDAEEVAEIRGQGTTGAAAGKDGKSDDGDNAASSSGRVPDPAMTAKLRPGPEPTSSRGSTDLAINDLAAARKAAATKAEASARALPYQYEEAALAALCIVLKLDQRERAKQASRAAKHAKGREREKAAMLKASVQAEAQARANKEAAEHAAATAAAEAAAADAAATGIALPPAAPSSSLCSLRDPSLGAEVAALAAVNACGPLLLCTPQPQEVPVSTLLAIPDNWVWTSAEVAEVDAGAAAAERQQKSSSSSSSSSSEQVANGTSSPLTSSSPVSPTMEPPLTEDVQAALAAARKWARRSKGRESEEEAEESGSDSEENGSSKKEGDLKKKGATVAAADDASTTRMDVSEDATLQTPTAAAVGAGAMVLSADGAGATEINSNGGAAAWATSPAAAEAAASAAALVLHAAEQQREDAEKEATDAADTAAAAAAAVKDIANEEPSVFKPGSWGCAEALQQRPGLLRRAGLLMRTCAAVLGLDLRTPPSMALMRKWGGGPTGRGGSVRGGYGGTRWAARRGAGVGGGGSVAGRQARLWAPPSFSFSGGGRHGAVAGLYGHYGFFGAVDGTPGHASKSHARNGHDGGWYSGELGRAVSSATSVAMSAAHARAISRLDATRAYEKSASTAAAAAAAAALALESAQGSKSSAPGTASGGALGATGAAVSTSSSSEPPGALPNLTDAPSAGPVPSAGGNLEQAASSTTTSGSSSSHASQTSVEPATPPEAPGWLVVLDAPRMTLAEVLLVLGDLGWAPAMDHKSGQLLLLGPGAWDSAPAPPPQVSSSIASSPPAAGGTSTMAVTASATSADGMDVGNKGNGEDDSATASDKLVSDTSDTAGHLTTPSNAATAMFTAATTATPSASVPRVPRLNAFTTPLAVVQYFRHAFCSGAKVPITERVLRLLAPDRIVSAVRVGEKPPAPPAMLTQLGLGNLGSGHGSHGGLLGLGLGNIVHEPRQRNAVTAFGQRAASSSSSGAAATQPLPGGASRGGGGGAGYANTPSVSRSSSTSSSNSSGSSSGHSSSSRSSSKPRGSSQQSSSGHASSGGGSSSNSKSSGRTASGQVLCENCQAAHDGTYGSGRFCSIACRSRFNGRSRRPQVGASLQELAEQAANKKKSKKKAAAAAATSADGSARSPSGATSVTHASSLSPARAPVLAEPPKPRPSREEREAEREAAFLASLAAKEARDVDHSSASDSGKANSASAVTTTVATVAPAARVVLEGGGAPVPEPMLMDQEAEEDNAKPEPLSDALLDSTESTELEATADTETATVDNEGDDAGEGSKAGEGESGEEEEAEKDEVDLPAVAGKEDSEAANEENAAMEEEDASDEDGTQEAATKRARLGSAVSDDGDVKACEDEKADDAEKEEGEEVEEKDLGAVVTKEVSTTDAGAASAVATEDEGASAKKPDEAEVEGGNEDEASPIDPCDPAVELEEGKNDDDMTAEIDAAPLHAGATGSGDDAVAVGAPTSSDDAVESSDVVAAASSCDASSSSSGSSSSATVLAKNVDANDNAMAEDEKDNKEGSSVEKQSEPDLEPLQVISAPAEAEASSSLTTTSSSSSAAAADNAPLDADDEPAPFAVGDAVYVMARTYPGMNKPGGYGRVTKVHTSLPAASPRAGASGAAAAGAGAASPGSSGGGGDNNSSCASSSEGEGANMVWVDVKYILGGYERRLSMNLVAHAPIEPVSDEEEDNANDDGNTQQGVGSGKRNSTGSTGRSGDGSGGSKSGKDAAPPTAKRAKSSRRSKEAATAAMSPISQASATAKAAAAAVAAATSAAADAIAGNLAETSATKPAKGKSAEDGGGDSNGNGADDDNDGESGSEAFESGSEAGSAHDHAAAKKKSESATLAISNLVSFRPAEGKRQRRPAGPGFTYGDELFVGSFDRKPGSTEKGKAGGGGVPLATSAALPSAAVAAASVAPPLPPSAAAPVSSAAGKSSSSSGGNGRGSPSGSSGSGGGGGGSKKQDAASSLKISPLVSFKPAEGSRKRIRRDEVSADEKSNSSNSSSSGTNNSGSARSRSLSKDSSVSSVKTGSSSSDRARSHSRDSGKASEKGSDRGGASSKDAEASSRKGSEATRGDGRGGAQGNKEVRESGVDKGSSKGADQGREGKTNQRGGSSSSSVSTSSYSSSKSAAANDGATSKAAALALAAEAEGPFDASGQPPKLCDGPKCSCRTHSTRPVQRLDDSGRVVRYSFSCNQCVVQRNVLDVRLIHSLIYCFADLLFCCELFFICQRSVRRLLFFYIFFSY